MNFFFFKTNNKTENIVMPFKKLGLQFICVICKNVNFKMLNVTKNYVVFLNFVVTKNFRLLLNGIGYFLAT